MKVWQYWQDFNKINFCFVKLYVQKFEFNDKNMFLIFKKICSSLIKTVIAVVLVKKILIYYSFEQSVILSDMLLYTAFKKFLNHCFIYELFLIKLKTFFNVILSVFFQATFLAK